MTYFVETTASRISRSPRSVFTVFDRRINFIVDSGASCCLLNKKYLPENVIINTNQKITIRGINGLTESLGTAATVLKCNNGNFNITFHIVKNLPSHIAGLLGTDFLLSHAASLNFERLTLRIRDDDSGKTHNIPLLVHDSQTCVIPARTEMIKYVKTTIPKTCLVVQQELNPHVFIANTIAEPEDGFIPVRIINLKNKAVKITNLSPKVKPITNYKVINLKNSGNSDPKRAEKLLKELKCSHIPDKERTNILKLCLKFLDIFHLKDDVLETTNVYSPTITVKANTQPVYSRPYRLPVAQRQEVDKQIGNMLKDNIIEKAKSEWNSPILLVPKKSSDDTKKWRLVIDYRKLNNVLEDDKFPLPNIEEIIDSLAGATYFSHLDLSQGYYQCELKPEDRKVTAFSDGINQFQMTRLPMGLKVSPSTFSRLMTVAMSGLNLVQCLIYLDDIIIFGKTLEEHNKNLMDVFNRLRKVNLKLNPAKCNFLKKELLYLGHFISAEGIRPDPAKIAAVKAWPTPKTADEVKRFVAFANYYRKHIQHFAKLCMPLNKLTRKNVPFEWTEACNTAFEKLRTVFVNPPVLDYPNFSSENMFTLHTDASGYAIGAVLSNNNAKPIAYASRALNRAEVNYSTIEKELLAVVWAIKHFRPYLYGRKFEVYSDHRPLVYLFTLSDPSSRLTKFRLSLEEYNFDVIYKKGCENVVADALSRISISDLKSLYERTVLVVTRSASKSKKENDERSDQPTSSPEKYFEIVSKDNISKIEYSPEKVAIPSKGTQFDLRAKLSKVLEYAKENKYDSIIININQKELIKIIKEMNEAGLPNIIILGEKIKIIKDEQEKLIILNDFHLLPTAGHAGIARTYATVKRKYYWRSMKSDIEKFVKSCKQCQMYKLTKPNKTPQIVTTTANYAFQKIYLDLVGPLIPAEGKEYILTTQCELTKFITATPIPNKAASTVAKAFVEQVILKYGVPERIASDRGTEFMSSIFDEVAKLLRIKKLNSTAYHHETIGSLENTHKCLGNFLRIYCSEKLFSWEHWVPYYTFAYNNTVHSTTECTPFYLVYGRPSNMPSNLTKTNEPDPIYDADDYSKQLRLKLQVSHKDVRKRLIQNKTTKTDKTNKDALHQHYKRNDLVLIKNETGTKLDQKYIGPFPIMEDLGPNVRVQIKQKEDIIHKNRIKRYN